MPEGIAVGRRKGMTGQNTLCGQCGQHFHRYKRNRPCVYTTEFEYHKKLADDAARAKQLEHEMANSSARNSDSEAGGAARRGARGRKGRSSLRESSTRPHTPSLAGGDSRMGTESPAVSDDQSGGGGSDSERESAARHQRARKQPKVIESPASSGSSSPSPPLAVQAAAQGKTGSPPADRKPVVAQPSPAPPAQQPAQKAPAPPRPDYEPWMVRIQDDLRSQRPDERFEIISRSRPAENGGMTHEWRVRCLFCPGRLCTSSLCCPPPNLVPPAR